MGPEGTGRLRGAGPGCGARGRRQGLAGTTQHRRRRRCGGRRRVRGARAGLEIDHSERSSRVAISRAAGPDGTRNTCGTTRNNMQRQRRAGSQDTRRPGKTALLSAAGLRASGVVDEARHVALEESGDGLGRARAVLGDDDVGFAGAVFLVVVVGAVQQDDDVGVLLE